LKNIDILVATDVAARGLDVNSLTHVIHYSFARLKFFESDSAKFRLNALHRLDNAHECRVEAFTVLGSR
jgi:superfamily II DNA/RNA helicase